MGMKMKVDRWRWVRDDEGVYELMKMKMKKMKKKTKKKF